MVAATEQEMEMHQQASSKRLAGVGHQLSMQAEDNMSLDTASTADSLTEMAMNKKDSGDG